MIVNYKINYVIILIFLLFNNFLVAKEYNIFNITQDFPMTDNDTEIKKNYYINLGDNQGVKVGDFISVYRIISRMDPYTTKKRYNYKLNIATLKIIHIENDSCITSFFNRTKESKDFYLEIRSPMIGDKVEVLLN